MLFKELNFTSLK